jgi:sugar lactone lactonase YvrE
MIPHSRFPLVFFPMVLCLLLAGNAIADTIYHVSTFAGSGSLGFVNGSGSNANFAQPNGLAVDGAGSVYVADMGNNAVRKISSNGVVTTLAGSGVSGFSNGNGTNASFWYPSGVSVDGSGNVYVADIYNHAIRKISSNGVVTTYAGKGTYGFRNGSGTNALFNYPTGVAVDGSGNVFVADSDNCSIRKISTNGVVTTFAGNGTSGFTDGSGTNAAFSFPQSVAVDKNGAVFVADSGNNAIRKITADGVVTTVAGNGSYGFKNGIGTNVSFSEPNSIAVDGSGNVFVADGNNVIRKITSSGLVTTLAGGAWGSADGDGSGAMFKYPRGIALDTTGCLYVADTDNCSIRKIVSFFRKTAQLIAFPFHRPVNYSPDLRIDLNATSSSGLPVNFSSDSPIVAIRGSTLAVLGAGTAAIVASQSGNDQYAEASSVTNVLLVAKASNAITFLQLQPKTFSNGGTVYLAATSPGGPVTFSCDNKVLLSIDGNWATIHGAGTTSIKASQKGSSNYFSANSVFKNLVINKAPQTISFTLPETNTFSSNGLIPLSGTSSSGLPVLYRSDAPSILAISGTNAVMKRRGSANVTASQPGDANYLGVTNAGVSITIQ